MASSHDQRRRILVFIRAHRALGCASLLEVTCSRSAADRPRSGPQAVSAPWRPQSGVPPRERWAARSVRSTGTIDRAAPPAASEPQTNFLLWRSRGTVLSAANVGRIAPTSALRTTRRPRSARPAGWRHRIVVGDGSPARCAVHKSAGTAGLHVVAATCQMGAASSSPTIKRSRL